MTAVDSTAFTNAKPSYSVCRTHFHTGSRTKPLQAEQVPRGGHGVNQMPTRTQHPGKLGLSHGREDVQKQVGPAVPHRGAKAAAADTERRTGQELGRQPHGLLWTGRTPRSEGRPARQTGTCHSCPRRSPRPQYGRGSAAQTRPASPSAGVVPGRQKRAAGANHGLAVAGSAACFFCIGSK